MADYKTMYEKLFRSQTKAIQILQEAQQVTEDMFIDAREPDIRLLPLDENTDEPTPEKEK